MRDQKGDFLWIVIYTELLFAYLFWSFCLKIRLKKFLKKYIYWKFMSPWNWTEKFELNRQWDRRKSSMGTPDCELSIRSHSHCNCFLLRWLFISRLQLLELCHRRNQKRGEVSAKNRITYTKNLQLRKAKEKWIKIKNINLSKIQFNDFAEKLLAKFSCTKLFRNLPRAIYISLPAITLIYMLVILN